MRTVLLFVVLLSSASSKAQTTLPLSYIDYTQQQSFKNSNHFADTAHPKKWFFTSYSGISTSFGFFRAGHAAVVAAPFTIQFNRRLNDNFYAFAAVSAAPSYISFSNAFLSAPINKAGQNAGFLQQNGFGVYSRASLGLMYINDQKTFSISGSIGVEKSSYPQFPYNQISSSSSITPVIYPH